MIEVKLPYFDFIFAKKSLEETKLNRTLNMHWGYWEIPSKAFTTQESSFINASDKLGELVYKIADIAEGSKLADIGCGFGGTIASINQKYRNIDIVGLNIDQRQIDAARKRVVPSNNNKIEFITADACDLPFENASIDSVIAVECIFHFQDRERFFAEVSRVLKPHGKFAFSDFVPRRKINSTLSRVARKFIGHSYGTSSQALTLAEYDEIAHRCGLKRIHSNDITDNIMPTYWAILSLIEFSCRGKPSFRKKIPTKILQLAQKLRILLYMVIGYQKI